MLRGGLATTSPPYFEGAQYKKTLLSIKKSHTDQFLQPVFAKICHFLSKMCQNLPFFGPKQVFSPWRGLPRPPPLFQGCPMQQKRVTGAKECTWTSFGSLSPPKCHIFRQKSAKINFGMSLLHKIIGVEAGRWSSTGSASLVVSFSPCRRTEAPVPQSQVVCDNIGTLEGVLIRIPLRLHPPLGSSHGHTRRSS